MCDGATRLYETTTTFTQNQAVPIKRYAHAGYGRMVIRGMMLFLLVLAVVLGVTVYREDHQEALTCAIICLVMAVMLGIGGRFILKYGAIQTYLPGDLVFTHTTWYDGKCFHRLDEDGDEFSWPLRRIRYAWRSGYTIFLCTSSATVIPVNLLQLSPTEREAFFELLKTECPKLVALE